MCRPIKNIHMILNNIPPSSAYKPIDPKDEYCQGINLTQYQLIRRFDEVNK